MCLEEELLIAWIKANSKIRNHRYVKDMTYNEAIILGLLYQAQTNEENSRLLQLKDLCQETKMLKSAVNRYVNNLEKKQYLRRIKLAGNNKSVYLILELEAIETYQKMHKEIIAIIKPLIEKLGKEKTQELVSLLTEVTTIFETNILNKSK